MSIPTRSRPERQAVRTSGMRQGRPAGVARSFRRFPRRRSILRSTVCTTRHEQQSLRSRPQTGTVSRDVSSLRLRTPSTLESALMTIIRADRIAPQVSVTAPSIKSSAVSMRSVAEVGRHRASDPALTPSRRSSNSIQWTSAAASPITRAATALTAETVGVACHSIQATSFKRSRTASAVTCAETCC